MLSVRNSVAAVAIAVCGLWASSAAAASYMFTFTGSAYDASGAFSTSNVANGDGTFDIVSALGNLTASDASLPQGAFTLYPGSGTTADGQSTYSNTYKPGDPGFAGSGIELLGSSFELNIYNGVLAAYPSCPGNCGSVPGTGYYNPGDVGELTITAVPEPATWAMMLVGVAGLGGALRTARRNRTATA